MAANVQKLIKINSDMNSHAELMAYENHTGPII